VPKGRVASITDIRHISGVRNSVFKNPKRLEYGQNNINVYFTTIYNDPLKTTINRNYI